MVISFLKLTLAFSEINWCVQFSFCAVVLCFLLKQEVGVGHIEELGQLRLVCPNLKAHGGSVLKGRYANVKKYLSQENEYCLLLETYCSTSTSVQHR